MENHQEESSSVLLSIFKRKGGEGSHTKIIDPSNIYKSLNTLNNDDDIENALIHYKKNESNWLVITTNKLIYMQNGHKINLPFQELLSVTIAVKEELKEYKKKDEFTRLNIIGRAGNSYIIQVEHGKPFNGIYQVLHHLASKNNSRNKQ